MFSDENKNATRKKKVQPESHLYPLLEVYEFLFIKDFINLQKVIWSLLFQVISNLLLQKKKNQSWVLGTLLSRELKEMW